jgi:ribosome-binding factor A
MGGYRAERVAEMVHKEVAERLRLEVKDPRLAPISITHVSVSRDLSVATVEFLPLGGGAPSKDLTEALADAARRIRGPIGRALRLRHAPEIHFKPDEHTEEAIRVTQLLSSLSAQRNPAPVDAPEGDGE